MSLDTKSKIDAFITARNAKLSGTLKPDEKKFWIDAFIADSFRDVADADYLTARICWRRDLGLNFFWMALQAIEKYLKGILLFHRESSQGFGHDVCKLLSRVKRLPEINLQFRPDVETFIGILNEQGLNRYFESNFERRGVEILLLDECIWQLRIRCVALKKEIKEGDPAVSEFVTSKRGINTLQG